MMICFTVGCTT